MIIQHVALNCIKTGCKELGKKLARTSPNIPIGKDLKYCSELSGQIAKKSKPLPVYSRFCICETHKGEGGLCLLPDFMPKDYLRKEGSDYVFTPHYVLDKLHAAKKGDGTFKIQSLVEKSLKDPDTKGRVMLEACCEDRVTAPGGFYYKLGFRFVHPQYNKECEQWLKMGGKYEDAPFALGRMYLPKENILHCLKYGYTEEEFNKYILPEIKDYIEKLHK
ncbi:hypothetical protein IJ596_00945 [bacterium]|nr:hypothetical protein [bacterium]